MTWGQHRVFFLGKRGRRPRVAGFIILSLKGLRRDEISCGVYGHIYLFIYLSVRLVYAGNDVTRITSFIVKLLVLLRRLAASVKVPRDAQTPGSAEDFQIVKLLLY